VTDLVRLEVLDGIGTIRLDRPPMNALNAEIQHGLIAACREAAERKDVAAVIVWGGEKVFAAGADIKEMETMSYTDMVDHSALLQDFTRSLAQLPRPTVAAITGYALGGGCEVALACDFRIAATTPCSGSPRSRSGSSPVPAAPSAWPGWSARHAPRTSSSPAGSSRRPKRWRSASSTPWSRHPRSTRARGA